MNNLTFATRVQQKENELTKDLTLQQLANIDHLQLNREAIKLVQADLATFDALDDAVSIMTRAAEDMQSNDA